jgi:SAM-dependent MidA family methyltransferase
MFGELIGLWTMAVWKLMGEPENVRLIELGPGRGTMMLDALRAAKALPGFRKAVAINFVEISPKLEERQRQAFATVDHSVEWYKAHEDVPPVQQAIMCADGWHERVVKLDQTDTLQFSSARDPIPLFDTMLPSTLRDAPIGEIFEWRSDQIALELGRRVVHSNGAALVIDYGHTVSAAGDTLQAVGAHKHSHPLLSPGTADLTAHVDFQALAQAAESMNARVYGPVEQAPFLRQLGLDMRAAALKKAVPPGRVGEIDAAYARLTSTERTGMGKLFKVIGFAHPKLGPLPGF